MSISPALSSVAIPDFFPLAPANPDNHAPRPSHLDEFEIPKPLEPPVSPVLPYAPVTTVTPNFCGLCSCP